MIRHVHHHLMGAAMAVSSCAVSAPVSFGVRGFPAVADGVVWRFALCFLGGVVLFGMLAASRSKWVGEVRIFEEAVPLLDPEALRPAEYSPRRNIVDKRFFSVLLVPSLVAGLALSPWLSLIPLWLSLDWLIRAGVAERWERKNAVLLWRGHVPDRSWELSYSPRRLSPPTRPGTDTPPE
ncbi:hypothetical protein OG349_00150 [Streptomyces sp. NBC_01317]|uniref:hypothetical protein n=1 Tax=Streptomyces sp. NBC_01317 TaxID=2903822 RepID=UPI002E0F5FFB|nr:hypothetical protein OG349_00150 [Streptomyces sp. NBC_01317]